MRDSAAHSDSLSTELSADDQSNTADEDFAELQRLLLGNEQDQLAEIQNRLNDHQQRANDISQVLPEAILVRSRQDDRIGEALVPNLEKALKESIQKDPRTLATVLFPIMAPSIRRAIFAAFREMVHTINQIMENAFSWQGLKWRIEAFWSKKSFGEIALLHSLIYRVDQVFLIHRSSGLVLQHVVRPEVENQDSDVVAGMLTAIRDFAHDSFDLQSDDLHTLEFGELRIWIEDGPYAYLAIVIRGTPPLHIRTRFQHVIEDIHLHHHHALATFDGDTTPFDDERESLRSCLVQALREREKMHRPYFAYALGSLFVVCLGYWIFHIYQNQIQLSKYLSRLQSTPGFVVTDAVTESGYYKIEGLRDPLSPEPEDLLNQENLNAGLFQQEWTPYFSLHPDYVFQRAQSALQPPNTVTLKYDSGTLFAQGSAPKQWIETAQRMALVVPGIDQFDFEELQVADQNVEKFIESLRSTPGYVITYFEPKGEPYRITGFKDPLARDFESIVQDEGLSPSLFLPQFEPYLAQHPPFLQKRLERFLEPLNSVQVSLDNGRLSISGVAPESWIADFNRVANSLALSFGFLSINQENLLVLEDLIQSLNQQVLFFDMSENRIRSDQESKFKNIVQDIQHLQSFSEKTGQDLTIQIIGHTCDIGNAEENKRLSRERAQNIIERFEDLGVDTEPFHIIEMGYNQPLRKGKTAEDRMMNRRVTFQVDVGPKDSLERK